MLRVLASEDPIDSEELGGGTARTYAQMLRSSSSAKQTHLVEDTGAVSTIDGSADRDRLLVEDVRAKRQFAWQVVLPPPILLAALLRCSSLPVREGGRLE
jgi:hypothetical protein